jgi:hypothetical protein
MQEHNGEPALMSSSEDKAGTFTINLEQVNSVFGISAETLRTLADSYGMTPEALLVRAITVWEKAEIPDLDLDSPELTPSQIAYLQQRRSDYDALSTSQPTTLEETFKRLIEGTGDKHAHEKSGPRNGGRR